MLVIPGQAAKDVCDRQVGVSRRDLLRIGGSGVLGMGLGSMLELKAKANTSEAGGGGPGAPDADRVGRWFLELADGNQSQSYHSL